MKLEWIFPTARSYVNFFFIWIFLIVMISTAIEKQSIFSLLSGFIMLYCYNEYSKEIRP